MYQYLTLHELRPAAETPRLR